MSGIYNPICIMRRIKSLSYLSFIFLILLIAGCRREYSQLKSSTRRVGSEVNFLNKGASSALSSAGIKSGQAKTDSAEGFAPIKQKNIINDYEFLYTALNLNPNGVVPGNLKWDARRKSYYVIDSSKAKLHPGVEIFGWHPTWMGDLWTSYPYELLTTISFYSYNVDPATGSYQNPEAINMWRTISMVDSAHEKDCRVLLSIACHGFQQNETFLKNEVAWNTLIDSVTVLLEEKKADGVDLDFESVPFDQKMEFIKFVEYFRIHLDSKLNGRRSYISISLPADNSDGFYDVVELQKQTDIAVIKGFDYPITDESNGAVSPMISDKGPSLEKTLNEYILQGIDTAKTILALPLYGSQWKGKWNKEGYIETTFDKKITYREMKSVYNLQDTSLLLQPTLDVKSMTNYYFLEFPDSTSVECWFDDDYTLGKKMDLAFSKKLKGIGLWALGYDQGYKEFWGLISDKYASDTLLVSDPVAAINGYPIKAANFFVRYSDLLFLTASIFAITFVISLFIAFSDWRVRNSIFSQHLFYYLFVIVCTILIIPLLGMLGFFADMKWKMIIAFIVGSLAGFLMSRITYSSNIKKP